MKIDSRLIQHAEESEYGLIYTPLEQKFIKYLDSMLNKKKIQKQGWMNPTNKYLAENFTNLKGKKVSERTIATLWAEVNKEYIYMVKGGGRFVYTESQLIDSKYRQDCRGIASQMRVQCESNASPMRVECEFNANRMQTECESNANRMQTEAGMPTLPKALNSQFFSISDSFFSKKNETTPTQRLAVDTPLTVNKPRKLFQKPELEEVSTYLVNEKSLSADRAQKVAQSFTNYYDANGWKVGKNKMVSWHGAIRNWLSNENDWANQRQQKYRKTNQMTVNDIKTDEDKVEWDKQVQECVDRNKAFFCLAGEDLNLYGI